MIHATCEVIFLRPADLRSAIPELMELDFDVEVLEDWIDDEGPARWILASIYTELDLFGFLDWVKPIVEPLGGDVMEVGLHRPPNEWREPLPLRH